MDIRGKILADMKTAMKDRNQVKLDTIRFLQSAIKYREIELRPNAISDDEIVGVVKKLVKQRKESIEQFAAGNRQDLVDSENAQLKILEEFLPAQLSRDQIEKIVGEAIAAVNAQSIKDMGPVIKEVMARAGSAADGKTVSELVKAKLTK